MTYMTSIFKKKNPAEVRLIHEEALKNLKVQL